MCVTTLELIFKTLSNYKEDVQRCYIYSGYLQYTSIYANHQSDEYETEKN